MASDNQTPRKSRVLSQILVRPAPLDGTKARLNCGRITVNAALGRGGVSAFKHEGDGATPLTDMIVLGGFRRAGDLRPIRSAIALDRVGADMGWCDAPDHPAYNRPVRLPFAASHEKLRRGDRLYDYVLILDWNFRARQRGKGSAIFLHIARDGYMPTEGCIAVSPRDMLRLLPHIGRGTRVRVVRN